MLRSPREAQRVFVALGLGILVVMLLWWRHKGQDTDVYETSVTRWHAALRSAKLKTQTPLPAWFGERTRTARRVAGVVLREGKPVPRAQVTLTSDATRTGLLKPLRVVTNDQGEFDFGSRRAAIYDVAATARELGFAHEVVDTRASRTPPSNAIVLRLSGCAHVIHGVIRDASGGMVEGAMVSRTRGRWAMTTTIGTGTVSGADGRYKLCTRAGKQTIVVSAAGYGAVTIDETLTGRRKVDVALVPEGIVVGRVVRDDTNEPAGGAWVKLVPAQWAGRMRTSIAETVTDAQGRFRIAGLAPGRHAVWASTADSYSAAARVIANPGSESREVTLRLVSTYPFRGTVVESGRPVGGARVTALLGRIRGTAIADDKGTFVVRLTRRRGILKFAVHNYKVISPAGYDARSPRVEPAVIKVKAMGIIRGKVVAGGKPIANAEVKGLSPAHKGYPSAVTGFNGEFELRGLSAGTYTVFGESQGARAFARKQDAQRISIGHGEVRENVVLKLGGAALIEGAVTDESGEALGRVYVQYTHTKTGDLCRATTSDDGAFSCAMMSGNGDYLPTIKPSQMSPTPFVLVKPGERVHLASGTSVVTGQQLRVRAKRSTIEGRVITQAGGPFPDVFVRASESISGRTPRNSPWIGFPFAITNADGRFKIDVWGSATYTVHARAPGGGDASVTNVRPDTKTVELCVKQPGTIQGTLSGFPHSAMVLVRRVGDTQTTHANVSGNQFSAKGLPAGTYAVVAQANESGAAESVTLRAGRVTKVTLRPRPTATLHGRVVDFVSGRPIAGAMCKLAAHVRGGSLHHAAQLTATTDNDGRFSMASPSGAVEVYCPARALAFSDGLARTTLAAGDTGTVEIPVITSKHPTGGFNGIGARLGIGSHSIIELRPKGAAQAGGLGVGDVITAIDGRDVSRLTRLGLMWWIGSRPIGSTVALTIRRGTATTEVKLSIEAPWW